MRGRHQSQVYHPPGGFPCSHLHPGVSVGFASVAASQVPVYTSAWHQINHGLSFGREAKGVSPAAERSIAAAANKLSTWSLFTPFPLLPWWVYPLSCSCSCSFCWPAFRCITIGLAIWMVKAHSGAPHWPGWRIPGSPPCVSPFSATRHPVSRLPNQIGVPWSSLPSWPADGHLPPRMPGSCFELCRCRLPSSASGYCRHLLGNGPVNEGILQERGAGCISSPSPCTRQQGPQQPHHHKMAGRRVYHPQASPSTSITNINFTKMAGRRVYHP